MKRLSYISKFSRPLSKEELKQIAEVSIRNNSRDNLTGVLFSFNDIFYQILEGPEDKLQECYLRILKDNRHTNIYNLEIEENIKERLYPDWAMNTIILEETKDSLMIPLRNILNSITKNFLILNKYVIDKIINSVQIGDNPLNWKLIETEKIVMFTDIFFSSTFGEILPKDDLLNLLNIYYKTVNQIIKQHNGEILKLTGDGVLAYFEISEINNSINAGIEICKELDNIRKNSKDYLKNLYTGIGITAGKIIEGNIGSEVKYDYTVIGDPVNRASRLESITRKLNYFLVFDEYFLKYLKNDNNYKIIKLGKYKPKSKTESIYIYSIEQETTKRKISLEKISSNIIQNI
ncbi:MAG: BLUF domain-containing protein [Leptonema sp. (in: bacteria)]